MCSARAGALALLASGFRPMSPAAHTYSCSRERRSPGLLASGLRLAITTYYDTIPAIAIASRQQGASVRCRHVLVLSYYLDPRTSFWVLSWVHAQILSANNAKANTNTKYVEPGFVYAHYIFQVPSPQGAERQLTRIL